MSSTQGRRRLLLILIAALALVVVLDRAGVFSSLSPESQADADTSAMYTQRAELLMQERQLVSSVGEWAQASRQAEEQWEEIRSRLIVERTRELAEEALRERIRAEMTSLGLAMAAAVPVRSADLQQSSDVQTIEVRVEFDTSDPASAYALAEKLERLADLATTVTRIELSGPGIVQLPESVQTKIWVRSIALVGTEAGS